MRNRKPKQAPVIQKSFADLLAACCQVADTSDFTKERWPLGPMAPDEDDWKVVEHHFTAKVTIKEGLRLLKEMAKKGEIRTLAGSRRAMEYIAHHQEAQLGHEIVLPIRAKATIGIFWNWHYRMEHRIEAAQDIWVVPIFHRDHSGTRRRYMHLYSIDYETSPRYGWLVLRKQGKRGTSVTG